MAELSPMEQNQNIKDLNTIRAIRRSRRREDLDEGINERLDRIEIQLENGQFVSKEDRAFLLNQSMESDNGRRYQLAHEKEDVHFEERRHEVRDEKSTIEMQEYIREAKEQYMNGLHRDSLTGQLDVDKISSTQEAINKLDELSANIGNVETKQPHLRSEAEKKENQEKLDKFEGVLKDELQSNEDSKSDSPESIDERSSEMIHQEEPSLLEKLAQQKRYLENVLKERQSTLAELQSNKQLDRRETYEKE